MKQMIKLAALAAVAGCLSTAAFPQDSTTTTKQTTTTTTVDQGTPNTTTQTTSTTTYYRGSATDIDSWSARDRMVWFTRNLRPSEQWQLGEILDAAPANIDIILVHAFSNVQQMSLQQVMMIGSDYSYSSTPVTTVTTTTAPDESSPTTTVTTTTERKYAPLNTVGYHGGRMSGLQAEDTLVMNLNQNERNALKSWMNTLVDGDYELILKIVKDGFDPDSNCYPYGVAWNRSVWGDHAWTTHTYREYNY